MFRLFKGGEIFEQNTQLAKYPHVLYAKPSNKVYILRPSERNAKKDKTVLHCCVCSIWSMFIKIHSKMACCLLVGTKSGRMKYLRKSFSSLVL